MLYKIMKTTTMKTNKKTYKIINRKQETKDVATLFISCEAGDVMYLPGQFITIYLPELGTPEGKAYSISSAPGEPMSITVRALGDFSRRLCELTSGDTFLASAPSGYFYSESDTSSLVMLTGGIGITPFRSMIVDSIRKRNNRNIHLFYSNKTVSDIVFGKELDSLASTYDFLNIRQFITREEKISDNLTKGRISAKTVTSVFENLNELEFFLCGSIPFVRDMWRGLKAGGVSEDFIYTEAFF